MSTMKALSDDEAGKEMRKMVAFIMQEASEKTREVQVKADEEFNIEKAKIVRQETAAIEQNFARKLKQVEVKRRIAQSIQINKANLQVLQARDTVLDEVLEDSKAQLKTLMSNPSTYQELLNKLVLQCLFRLMDENVSIICRAQDTAMVQQAINKALNEYKKVSGRQCQVAMDKSNLPTDSVGGVIAVSTGGRIRCDNTLESRLDNAFEGMLPKLRVQLVGHSENRKFFD